MNNYLLFFNDLKQCKNIDEVKNLFNKYKISRRDRMKYPDIEFNISADEINELKKKEIITKENIFNINLHGNKSLTTLEKILYSMLWKQGDLKKEKHIISGILGIDTDRVVFNQFGKHLQNKENIILDQHVLRSFIFYKTKNVEKIIKDKHYLKYSDEYKKWIENNELFRSNKNIIDELLMGFGKKIKRNIQYIT